jgi:general secretion pathway protein G
MVSVKEPILIRRHGSSLRGFTLIEILVALSIIMMLVGLAAPAHFNRIQLAKETVLQQNLLTMRSSIDRFYTDTGRYPKSIQELVELRYLASLPIDPIVEAADQWVLIAATEEEPSNPTDGISNVKSSADGSTANGVPYANL